MVIDTFFYDRVEDSISKFGKIYKIEELKGASPNFNWLIQTTKGEKFVIQQTSYSLSKITLLNYLINYMCQNKVPISKILDFWVTGEEKQQRRTWILKKYVTGRLYTTNSVSDAIQAAYSLQKLHSLPIGHLKKYEYLSCHDPFHWISNPDKEIRDFVQEASGRKETDTILKYLNEALKEISCIEYQNLPHSIVHGDFHGGNLIYKKNELSSLIDFDTLGVSPRINDISYGIFFMSRYQKSDFNLGTYISRNFLKTYTENNLLTNNEYKHFATILALRLIPRGSYIRLLKNSKPEIIPNYFEWILKALEGLYRNRKKILLLRS